MADPRPLDQRLADTRARLENDIDLWIASAHDDQPWLVPISFVWWEGEIWIASMGGARTQRNLTASPVVRLALGELRDVVIVDGRAEVSPMNGTPKEVLDIYAAKQGGDPSSWADSLIRVRPTKIQAWREENELEGRHLMRNGRWLDEGGSDGS